MRTRTYDFNKEIIFSEFGSIFGGPVFGYLSSLFSNDNSLISAFTVAGAVIGSSILWLLLRISDEKRRGAYSLRKLLRDLMLFAPFASIIAVIIVYPTIFFATKLLLDGGASTIGATAVGSILGAGVYLIIMNIYRILLKKRWDIGL